MKDFMKDYPINKKLKYCFGCLIALFLVMFMVSTISTIYQKKIVNDVKEKNVTSSVAIGTIKEKFQRNSVLLRNLIILEPASQQYSDVVTQLDENYSALLAALEKYHSVNTSEESTQVYETLKNDFNTSMSDAIATVKEYTAAGNSQAAYDLLFGKTTSTNSLIQSMADLDTLNDKMTAELTLQAQKIQTISIIVMVVICCLCIYLSIVFRKYFTQSVANKIERVVDVSNAIAEGDLDHNIEKTSNDEIGDLADSFNKMILAIRNESEIVQQIAVGDLTSDYKPSSEKDIMGNALSKSLNELNDIFDKITIAVSQVKSGAEQVSMVSQSVSQGATNQASSVEELAATIEKISGDVKNNAISASKAKDLVSHVESEVDNGNQQMNHMITAMNDINSSSAEISKIIKVIDDIAFQTNILALNAAVEAARAGAAGKGFAVVADEVRNLASKSAAAAKNTTVLIENSITKVNEGTKIADSTAESLKVIVQSINEVASLVSQIDSASAQQDLAITQINQGMEEISSVIQTSSATAEETASASEELSKQASTLSESLQQFKLKRRSIPIDAYDNHDNYIAQKPQLAEAGYSSYPKQFNIDLGTNKY